MYGYYNGKSETGTPCQSHLQLHSGYRYKFKKFYELCGETFVEIEGIDNQQDKDVNPGFNLSWFATTTPRFAFSKHKPVPSSRLAIETVGLNGENEKICFMVLDVTQIAVNTYIVFADDYQSYIVQM